MMINIVLDGYEHKKCSLSQTEGQRWFTFMFVCKSFINFFSWELFFTESWEEKSNCKSLWPMRDDVWIPEIVSCLWWWW